MNEDDPDRGMEFFECFLLMCDERKYFPDCTVWFDEATFKLSATVS
jgi:hypothetical protein